jgi:DNA repair exonuclease SbcCD ATPase subunit
MAIPSVVQGLIEAEDGKVFELDSPKGAAWLETIGSFRFEPSGDSKPCTIRREPSGYWCGCRKIAGKVRKKYIGKSSEVSLTKLEEIAAALEVPPVQRVKQVAEVAEVAEVAQEVAEVAQEVAEVAEVAQDRLAALELEVANLRKALEALQEPLRGKSEAGDSEELPKVDSEVAEKLQNELSNLKAENEKLRADYDALLESSTVVADNLRRGVRELQARLEVERADREEVEAELAELAQIKKEAKEAAAEVHREGRSIELEKVRWQRELSDARAELADAKATILNQSNKIRELERGYSLQPNPAESRLRLEIGNLQSELADQKQKSVAASKDLPEVADLLNQLKARRKKSRAELADVELILEMIEES